VAGSAVHARRKRSIAVAPTGRRRAPLTRRCRTRRAARLLRRTTRSLVLTDVGEVFYRQASIALEAVRLAEESVRMSDDVVRGDLRISVPPMMNASFHAMLCEFAARYPALRVHVHTSSQHVDVLNGYDVALRTRVSASRSRPRSAHPGRSTGS
jgi:DNA-binding transcriptional LysR family regulator